MNQTSLIATLLAPPSPNGAELTRLPDSVQWLEVRADLVGEIDPDWIRNHFRGRLIYSFGENSVERQQRLIAAAATYDRVELDADRDVTSEVLSQVPQEKRIIAWNGHVTNSSELREQFDRVSATPAALYRVVTKSERITDEFLPLWLLKSLRRTDTVAYSLGTLGFWNRLIALQLGAPAIYGAATANSAFEPSVVKLIDDYGLPEVTPVQELFAIIGNPVFHSLSPRLHNASYRAMKYPALFVPLLVNSFDEFWREFVQSKSLDGIGFPINGMTVASPHKEEALQAATNVSAMARQAEAANILVRNNGWWNADTTDPDVVYAAKQQRSVKVREKRAAVIGCGGAGRAIAAALVASGAGVTLINRGAERGEHAAALLGLDYVPLPDFDAHGYDIVVNATPVGRDTDEIPFKIERLNNEAVVIDLVYGTRTTPLIGGMRARSQVAIDGRDVLLTQVRHQFQMMTGKEMPDAISVSV
ncbi:MAG TPA: type I 3-dehydroquinate dehydratase [Pyrinomonadaceae bacterium]|jgi:3-dehydroquinate dehydratase/shikimate dehydrogenase|nr:type I 3-dehydroquinate dehydratase [Pyrinomonadaceae bacterium]